MDINQLELYPDDMLKNEGKARITREEKVIGENMEIGELSELVRKIWPGWEIEKRIGRGAYGTVYEAVSAEGQAAIKLIQIPQDEAELDLLRAEGYSEEAVSAELKSIRQEYEDEIRVMQSMRDAENVVRIDDFSVTKKTDTVGWILLIRMELLTPVTGYFAAFESDDAGALAHEVTVLGRDICQALAGCEEKKIIHRDIKPENIFTDTHGNYKLGDFGSARQHETTESMVSMRGTFNYMAPETYNRTGWYGPSTDLYSLGLVMYRYLNRNRLPFLDPDRQILSSAEREGALRRRMQGEELPMPCQASEALAAVILKACAYEPENRFQCANEMKEALERILQENQEMKGSDRASEQMQPGSVPESGIGKTSSVNEQTRQDSMPESEQARSNSMPESGVGKSGSGKAKEKKILTGVLVVILLSAMAFLSVRMSLRDDRQTENSGGTENADNLQTELESTDTLQTESESTDTMQTESESTDALQTQTESTEALQQESSEDVEAEKEEE